MADEATEEERAEADKKRVEELKQKLEAGTPWTEEEENFMIEQSKHDNELEEDDEE